MKFYFIFALICAISGGISAQSFSRTNPVKVETSAITTTVTIAGKTFTGGLSKTGSTYIVRTSKEGKVRKAYLGTKTTQTFEGSPVWTNKDKNKFWIYDLGRTGFPKGIPLTQD